MQIYSLSTLKSPPSLLLFVILSTAQTYHPISKNILINDSPIVRVQKAYFLETPHFGSTTQYNMNRKTIRFFLAVSAEHRRYNSTLYNIFYYIQICGVRTRTKLSDSLRRILSEQRPEKTCRKKKTRQEMWVGSMAHALKSPSYEGYTAGRTLPLFTKQVFQQRTANSK